MRYYHSGSIGLMRGFCAKAAGTTASISSLLSLRAVDMAACGKYNQSMSAPSAYISSIREYRPEDAASLHTIDQLCFPPDIAYSGSELLFYLNHPGSVTLVAERGEKIIGFALGRVQTNHLAHVLTLDVLPEARRQRVGTILMCSLHSEFKKREVSRVVLEVSTRNLAARRLYEALHYRLQGILRGYYGREDAYRMVLALL